MTRGLLVFVITLIICAGLGPATASDVFINRYKNNDADKKPTLYIKRSYSNKTYKSKNGAAKSFYKDKLSISQKIHYGNGLTGVYDAWEKSSRKPRTPEEVLSYADAQRARGEVAMLKRRQQIIIAQENRSRMGTARFAGQESKSTHKKSSSHAFSRKTQKKTFKQKPVFVQPDRKTKTPRKLFPGWN